MRGIPPTALADVDFNPLSACRVSKPNPANGEIMIRPAIIPADSWPCLMSAELALAAADGEAFASADFSPLYAGEAAA